MTGARQVSVGVSWAARVPRAALDVEDDAPSTLPLSDDLRAFDAHYQPYHSMDVPGQLPEGGCGALPGCSLRRCPSCIWIFRVEGFEAHLWLTVRRAPRVEAQELATRSSAAFQDAPTAEALADETRDGTNWPFSIRIPALMTHVVAVPNLDRLILVFRATFASPVLLWVGYLLTSAFKFDASLTDGILSVIVPCVIAIAPAHLAAAAILARRLGRSTLTWVGGYVIAPPFSALIAFSRLDAMAREYKRLRPNAFDRV